MIKCIYNDKRYSIIIVNARFKAALGMHMQLDVVITLKISESNALPLGKITHSNLD